MQFFTKWRKRYKRKNEQWTGLGQCPRLNPYSLDTGFEIIAGAYKEQQD